MVTGAAVCGNVVADGTIREVAARAHGAGVDVSFYHEGAPLSGAQHLVVVTLDGEPQALMQSTGGAMRFNLPSTIGAGNHRLSVVPVRASATRIPGLHGVPYGRRAWVQWEPSDAGDLAGYRVYGKLGAVPVPGVDAALVTVSGAAIWPVWLDRGLSIGGTWQGSRETNATFALETDGAGQFRDNVAGSWSAWRAVLRGQATLSRGVVVTFHEAPESYGTDSWEIRVAPRNWWASGELAAGTWHFLAEAVDTAGNAGDATTAVTVAILHRPDGVTGLQGVFDPGADPQCRLEWALPAGTWAGVEIFSNLSNATGRLKERVIETSAWRKLAGDATSCEFDAPAGVFRAFVRVRDEQGRLSDDSQLVEINTAAAPTGVELNEPDGVTVIPGPGGVLTVRWRYGLEGGTSADRFLVYLHEDEEAPSFDSPAATVMADDTTSQELWLEGTWTSGVLAGPRWVTVRAADGSGNTDGNASMVPGVPDSVGPNLSGRPVGVPN